MKKFFNNILSLKYWWLLLIVLFVTVNFLASVFHTRFDLTKEKRYSISQTTKNIVKGLNDEAEVEVFLKGDLPSGFKKLANSTAEFLQLLKENNTAHFNYKFISPDDEIETGKTYGDSLAAMGVTPINLTVQIKQGQQSNLLFPVAVVKYKGQQSIINLYPESKRIVSYAEMNSAETMMEYEFTKTLDALINPEKPLIAYSIGNKEPVAAETFSLQQVTVKDYELHTFNINAQSFIPDTFKVLMIVKPSLKFTEEEKLKIDQYVMHGGKLLCFIDNLYAEQDSLQYKNELTAFDRGLDLTDLFFQYGVRINDDLVMDLQCDFMPFAVGGTRENPQYEFLHWNYYPLFEPKSTSTITKNLGLVAARFVNSIDTVKAAGIKKTVLLSSSNNSRILGTPAIISLNENRNTPEDEMFKKKDIPVAVLLEGKFSSLFKNRFSNQTIDTLKTKGISFAGENGKENKMIIVSDGDIVLNDFSKKQGPLQMGMNLYTANSQYEYPFANKDFLQNCLEYLTGKQGIIETKNKDLVLRLLDSKKMNDQKTMWQIINIAAPLLLIILYGFVYQQLRRKKYAA
jgi:gliding-associated putative ABC transporter substrate-binding component GldG